MPTIINSSILCTTKFDGKPPRHADGSNLTFKQYQKSSNKGNIKINYNNACCKITVELIAMNLTTQKQHI
jgi:hypothetical protein